MLNVFTWLNGKIRQAEVVEMLVQFIEYYARNADGTEWIANE